MCFLCTTMRAHTLRMCVRNNNVNVLDWPPYSPDMHPIKHLWDHLDRQDRSRDPTPQNHVQLRQVLIEIPSKPDQYTYRFRCHVVFNLYAKRMDDTFDIEDLSAICYFCQVTIWR